MPSLPSQKQKLDHHAEFVAEHSYGLIDLAYRKRFAAHWFFVHERDYSHFDAVRTRRNVASFPNCESNAVRYSGKSILDLLRISMATRVPILGAALKR